MNNKPFRRRQNAIPVRESPYTVTATAEGTVRKAMLIQCPFCNTETWADDWSLRRQGKKCNCGAHFRQDGIAIARV